MMQESNILAYKSPIGTLKVLASPLGVQRIDFPGLQPSTGCHLDQSWRESMPNKHLDQAEEWLTLYFSGKFNRLPALAFDLTGTDFEKRVWNQLLSVSVGSLETYGNLAAKVGSPKAARAVGSAVGRNPVAIIIPCHRIIAANRELTGFGGGLTIKHWLLNHEGFLVTGTSRNSKVEGLSPG